MGRCFELGRLRLTRPVGGGTCNDQYRPVTSGLMAPFRPKNSPPADCALQHRRHLVCECAVLAYRACALFPVTISCNDPFPAMMAGRTTKSLRGQFMSSFRTLCLGAAAMSVLGSASVFAADTNPFSAPSTLPYQTIPWDRIKDSDYQPAFEEAMKQQLAEIDAVANNPAA